MSKNFTSALCMMSLLSGSLSLSAQSNRGLSFNSVNEQYATSDPGVYLVPALSDATIEMWVYVPASQPGQHHFLSVGDPGVAFYMGYDGSSSDHLIMGDGWPGGSSNVSLPMGQWNHIALTVDGNGFQAFLYLNGKLVDTTENTYFTYAGSGTQLQLGNSVDPGSPIYSTFTLDQVRIWSVRRTQAEIKAGMYGAVSPSDPNLVAYYKLDETSGTNVANSTLVTGADMTTQGTPTTPSFVTVPVQFFNNALTFDVTNNSQVNMPADSVNITRGTLEAWVKPGAMSNEGVILANSDGTGSRFKMVIDNSMGNQRVGLLTSAGAHYVNYIPTFTPDNWYHIAMVTDYSTMDAIDTTGVFVKGEYIGRISAGYDASKQNLPLHIGGNGVDNTQQFKGAIDEVRIWSVPHTDVDIAANITNSLVGNESGLVSVWSFDQGIPNGNNTGMLVAMDNAPQSNHGTLQNFALTASSPSNFSDHIITLPVTLVNFRVNKQGNDALVQWQTAMESNTRDFIIERSTNGKDFYNIGAVPAAGNSRVLLTYAFLDKNPVEGNNYYRLKQRDLDNTATYSEVKLLSFFQTGKLIWYSTGDKTVEVLLQQGANEIYTVTGASGEVAAKGRLSNGKAILSGIPSGVYVVRVVSTNGSETITKILLR